MCEHVLPFNPPKPQGRVPLPLSVSTFSEFSFHLPPPVPGWKEQRGGLSTCFFPRICKRTHSLFTVHTHYTHTHTHVHIGLHSRQQTLDLQPFLLPAEAADREVDSWRVYAHVVYVSIIHMWKGCGVCVCVCVWRIQKNDSAGSVLEGWVCGWGLVQQELYCIRLWLIEGFMFQMGFWWGQASIFLVWLHAVWWMGLAMQNFPF